MAVSNDLEIKKRLYKALDPNPREPIEPDGDYYITIYPDESDPIMELRDKIVVAGSESIQLLSGCRGSGKTTELHRLRRLLEKDGYCVFRVDALEYLNPAEPIEIGALLVVLAAALSEQVEEKLGASPTRQSYLTRFWNYLNLTEVELREFGFKGGVAGFAGEFKTTFRTTPSFRQKIHRILADRTSELKAQVNKFFEDATGWLTIAGAGPAGFVFMFDQFEQLRGGLTEEQGIMESIERIFTQSFDLLRFPYIHLIYTVPPWLRYRAPGAVRLERTLPCVKLWEYSSGEGDLQPCQIGWDHFRDLLTRRIGAEHLEALFGPLNDQGQRQHLDDLILYCGGHFRDLLFLANEALVTARSFPISSQRIDAAVKDLRDSMPISIADSLWLREVATHRRASLPDSSPENVGRFTRLLDNHLVLLFSNGRDWYDVHPVIREEVLEIAARADASKAATGATTEAARS